MLDFDHAQTLLANAAGPLDRVEDVALADLPAACWPAT